MTSNVNQSSGITRKRFLAGIGGAAAFGARGKPLVSAWNMI